MLGYDDAVMTMLTMMTSAQPLLPTCSKVVYASEPFRR